MMKRPHIIVLKIACFLASIGLASIAALVQPALANDNTANQSWEGVWFTCEHAGRQRAPDEGCQMFDDEGFSYQEGQLSYLRMKGSDEAACRGNKIGQCFKRDSAKITVTSTEIGEARIANNRLIVRYWGCEQSYQLEEGPDFMTVKPLGKSCLWSQERHFYIARYEGVVNLK